MRKAITRFVVAVAAGWIAGAGAALAQAEFPTRPIQVMLGFPPGGGADIVGRQFVAAMQRASGKSIVLVNKPGNASNLSITLAKDARPDGHTLVIGSSSSMVGAHFFFKDIEFDALRDFVPLGGFLEGTFVLVTRNETPVSTPQELFAWMKARPMNRFAYANQLTLLAGEYVKAKAGVAAERVAYKSATDAYPDLNSGAIEYMVADATTASGLIRDKKVKPIAIMGAQRHPSMPGVPTMREAGFEDADFTIWMALWAPIKTDPAIAAKLEEWVLAAGRDKEFADFLEKTGNTAISEPGASIRERLKREQARWSVMVKAAGVEPQ